MPRNKEQTEHMRLESRRKIIETARRLFAEKSFAACNVSDIANASGMSQGNIYWYFPSKQDIFSAVLADGFQTLGNLMEKTAAETGSAREKLQHFLDRFFTMMNDPGGEQFLSIIMALANQGGGLNLEEFGLSNEQIGNTYHHSLNTIFAQGQKEGTFPTGIDPNLMSTFMFSFVNGLMVMYPSEWKQIPRQTIYQAIYGLLGISST